MEARSPFRRKWESLFLGREGNGLWKRILDNPEGPFGDIPLLHDEPSSHSRLLLKAHNDHVGLGIEGLPDVGGRGSGFGEGMGVEDGEEGPAFTANPLHRIELLPGVHLVADGGVEAVCHGENGHGAPRAIGRHQTAGLFRAEGAAMVENLLENCPWKENIPPLHQEAGTWQTHSEEPETLVMVGEGPHRAQWGSLGTLSLRKVMERAS